jgi:hypothetical protein
MSDSRYKVCEPSVVSEVIDGEAIIMDLRSGAYFSAEGLGAQVWQAAVDGASEDEIVTWAAEAFPTQASAGVDVAAFLKELVARELLVRADGAAPHALSLPTAHAPYKAPALAVHEDMQDLITLDPIHDVDQVGWPTRKVDAGTI